MQESLPKKIMATAPATLPHHRDDDIDVGSMIVNDLRKELKKRKLGTSGRKAELQARLREDLAEGRRKREVEWVAKHAAAKVGSQRPENEARQKREKAIGAGVGITHKDEFVAKRRSNKASSSTNAKRHYLTEVNLVEEKENGSGSIAINVLQVLGNLKNQGRLGRPAWVETHPTLIVPCVSMKNDDHNKFRMILDTADQDLWDNSGVGSRKRENLIAREATEHYKKLLRRRECNRVRSQKSRNDKKKRKAAASKTNAPLSSLDAKAKARALAGYSEDPAKKKKEAEVAAAKAAEDNTVEGNEEGTNVTREGNSVSNSSSQSFFLYYFTRFSHFHPG